MTKSCMDKIKNRPGDGAVANDVEAAQEMILSFPDFVYPESERVDAMLCRVLTAEYPKHVEVAAAFEQVTGSVFRHLRFLSFACCSVRNSVG